MNRLLVLLLAASLTPAEDVLTVDPAGTVVIAGSSPATAPATGEVQVGGGQVKAGGTVTAGDVVINRVDQASGAQAVRGDDPRLGGAIFWAAIRNNVRINITASDTPATLNRLHVITGTSADYDINIGSLSPTIGDLLGFQVSDYSAADKLYRLDAGGIVKIAGRTRYLVLTHTNVVLLMWDGTGWQPLVLNIDSPWVNAGPITISGTTMGPGKGTRDIDRVMWRRSGRDIVARYEYRQIAAGTSGSGHYLLHLPIGSIDTGFISSNTVVDGYSWAPSAIPFGGISASSSAQGPAVASVYDSGRIRIEGVDYFQSTNIWGSTFYSLHNPSIRIGGTVVLPMLNW